VGSSDKTEASRVRLNTVLTDVHFWVPLAVLVAGLLLLNLMR